jgi:hypothetical protein
MAMAFSDLCRTRIAYQSLPTNDNALQTVGERAALEVIGTLFVLMGIALGILMLRFALVLLRGLH